MRKSGRRLPRKINQAIQAKSSSRTKEWCIRIKVSLDEEKNIKRKILDSEMNIGEYTRKKLLES